MSAPMWSALTSASPQITPNLRREGKGRKRRVAKEGKGKGWEGMGSEGAGGKERRKEKEKESESTGSGANGGKEDGGHTKKTQGHRREMRG